MSTSQWTSLAAQGTPDEEPVVFKFVARSGGYFLQVSDLSNVWAETFTKRDIIDRAQGSNCPIDPSQDDEQLDILIRHLEKALLADADTVTKCQLTRAAESLDIEVECSLPAGLQPLQWSFALEGQKSPTFRNDVVMPLIEKVNAQRGLVDELVHLLNKKDIAIANLIDKVDSSGIDLATVFPTASANRTGRKIDKKEHIKRTVKGLQQFDSSAFFEQHRSADKKSRSLSQAFGEAQGKPGSGGVANSEPESYAATTTFPQRHSPAKHSAATRPAEAKDGVESEDRRSSARSTTPVLRAAEHKLEDDTTEDETDDDLDGNHTPGLAPQNDVVGAPVPEPAQSTLDPPKDNYEAGVPSRGTLHGGKKLGTIGGPKQPTSDTSSRDATPAVISSANEGPSAPASALSSPKKSKIGAIGGRKAAKATSDESKVAPDPSTKNIINRDEGSTVSKPVAPHAPTSRTPNENTTSESATEATENDTADPKQDADHKRQALKRELEARAKSQNKKKRKF